MTEDQKEKLEREKKPNNWRKSKLEEKKSYFFRHIYILFTYVNTTPNIIIKL